MATGLTSTTRQPVSNLAFHVTQEAGSIATGVNVWIANWVNQETTVPVPKWAVDIKIQWTDEANNPHEHEETYYFPNILAGIPMSRLRKYMEQLILAEVRIALGIDEG